MLDDVEPPAKLSIELEGVANRVVLDARRVVGERLRVGAAHDDDPGASSLHGFHGSHGNAELEAVGSERVPVGEGGVTRLAPEWRVDRDDIDLLVGLPL